MKDQDKNNEQLIKELRLLRKEVAKLRKAENNSKRIEEVLRESVGSSRLLFFNNPLPMWVYDLKTLTFLAVNNAAIQHYGYTRKQFLSMTIKEIHPTEDIPALLEKVSEVTTGLDVAGTWRHRKKDGTIIHVEITSHTLTFAGRRAEVVVAQDITERMRAEEALLMSEKLYKRLLESVTDYSYSVKVENGHPVATSHGPSCVAVTGYMLQEFEVDPNLWYRMIHREDREAVTEQATKLLSGETASPIEHRIIHKDDSIHWVKNTAVPRYDEQGKLIAYEGLVSDITERKQAEEALRTSEEKYRTLVESSLQGTIIYQDSRFVFANPAVAEILGYRVEELTTLSPKEVSELTHSEDRELVFGRIRDGFVGEAIPSRYEFHTIRKDGTVRWLEMFSNVIKYRGKPAIQTHIVDITERKRAEKALQHRVEFEKLITTISTKFINLEPDEIDTEINRALQTIGEFADVDRSYVFLFSDHGTKMNNTHEWCTNGIEPQIENLKGLPVATFPWWLEKLNCFENIHIPRIAELPPEASNEKQFIQSQQIRSLLVVPMVYGGVLIGFLGFDSIRTEKTWMEEDITLLKMLGETIVNALERKQTEEALRLTQFSVDHAGYAIFWIGPDARFLYVNKIACKSLGYTCEELLARAVCDIDPNFPAEIWPEHWQEVKQRGSFTIESIHHTKDGRSFPVEITVNYLEFGGKEYNCAFARDITERKRLEEELARAQRLETAGRVAGQIAHDFNNLLAPLTAYPDLMREDLEQKHPMLGMLDEMESAAKKIAEINQQLLTLGRRGHYTLEPIDLKELVQKVVLAQGLPEEIVIREELDPDLFLIKGGAAQLTRALTNLINNAKEAMHDIGVLTIKIKNVYLDKPLRGYQTIERGEYVQLVISDTGTGIEPANLDKIFDPFFTTKKMDRMRGSGLGLSVVNGVIQDHNGYIIVESTIGQGTTFSLYFPIIRELECKIVETIKKTKGGHERILIVDDDPVQRSVAGLILKRLGYKVHVVSSGEKAVTYVKKHPQDLLVLDMVMEGIDGADTYRKILDFQPGQKAIILSGYATSHRILEAQRLGAGSFISKPVTLNALAMAIRKELDKKRKRRRTLKHNK